MTITYGSRPEGSAARAAPETLTDEQGRLLRALLACRTLAEAQPLQEQLKASHYHGEYSITRLHTIPDPETPIEVSLPAAAHALLEGR